MSYTGSLRVLVSQMKRWMESEPCKFATISPLRSLRMNLLVRCYIFTLFHINTFKTKGKQGHLANGGSACTCLETSKATREFLYSLDYIFIRAFG